MPGKTEWIDLKREKRELDEFLSAIAGDEAVLPEENVFTSGDVLAQDKPDAVSGETKAEKETQTAEDGGSLPDADGASPPEELTGAMNPPLSADAAPREPEEPAAPAAEEEISVPLGSIETMAKFDDAMEPVPPPEQRKAFTPASAPRKEDGGILYWIKMAAAFFITMTLAVLAGYFWVYPERGAQVIDRIQSLLMG